MTTRFERKMREVRKTGARDYTVTTEREAVHCLMAVVRLRPRYGLLPGESSGWIPRGKAERRDWAHAFLWSSEYGKMLAACMEGKALHYLQSMLEPVRIAGVSIRGGVDEPLELYA